MMDLPLSSGKKGEHLFCLIWETKLFLICSVVSEMKYTNGQTQPPKQG
jgi:hypothetical protein